MKIVLDDTLVRSSLYPFGLIKPVAAIRVGILTIKEKWEQITGEEIFDSFKSFFENVKDENEKPHFVIPSNVIPTKAYWLKLKPQPGLQTSESIDIAGRDEIKTVIYPWQLFQYNDWALQQDYDLITAGRISQPISQSNKVAAPENIFIEEGAKVEHSFLNATGGPIYIGKNTEVMEGCMIRGAFALCENAVLKMGSKIYGAVTIGPNCAAAGEIKNSILMANSNKAHDGYLGDSVIGEWCNLGAGTTNSNVKNTAGIVNMWHHPTNSYLPVGPKAGLVMGDYSRAAINTSFNTGTVAGICCNIFGAGFPKKYIPDFTWGNQKYIFEKALQDIDNWKQFKGQRITENEIEILHKLYNKKT
jgi:UDP-N-acetylglucosamine diphosphorylase/glucosamine-1-phosphate N-acetyltransferase